MHFLFNALYEGKLDGRKRPGGAAVLDLGGGRYDFYHNLNDGVLVSDEFLQAEPVDAVLRSIMPPGSYRGYNGGLPCMQHPGHGPAAPARHVRRGCRACTCGLRSAAVQGCCGWRAYADGTHCYGPFFPSFSVISNRKCLFPVHVNKKNGQARARSAQTS
jgi:hypothetical protein